MFKVLKYFEDLQDNRHAYQAGDIFPRPDLAVSPERFEELSTTKNCRKTALIEFVEEDGFTSAAVATNEPVSGGGSVANEEQLAKPKRGREKKNTGD